MKHHDSILQADQKLALAVKQLKVWGLPATPINYSVSYEFINNKNKRLIERIQQQLSSGKPLDNFFIDEVYRQVLIGESKFRDDIVTDIDKITEQVQQSSQQTSQQAEQLISKIDKNSEYLFSPDKAKIKKALTEIHKASNHFRIQQGKLNLQLQQSQIQTQSLKKELGDISKEMYIDPLTNLYNREALNKHVNDWINDDPNKPMAAIVINVDQLSLISEKYGSLISDVLLAKIANKVSSYMTESALPVRSAGDEFTILLPEIEEFTATEMAETIRQGVERLRFVSSKTGTKLPKITVSLGVNSFNLASDINDVINQTRELIKGKQQSLQYNQTAIAS